MPRTWHEGLAGARQVEDEHRLQLELIDVAEELLRRGDASAAREALARLADLSDSHFRTEELLMRLYAYGEGEAHAVEHRAFAERLQEIREHAGDGATGRPLESIAAWRSALLEHIERADGHFARAERAIRFVQGL